MIKHSKETIFFNLVSGHVLKPPFDNGLSKMSEYLNLHGCPHVEDLPSYLRDTTAYLNKTPSSGR